MKFMKNSLALILITFFLTNCSQLKELADIKKPTVSVDDFRITGLSIRNVELTFDIEVDNPNAVALTLASYDYDLKIEENSFVQGSQPLNTTIDAKGNSMISVPVTFTFRELYETFSTINSKRDANYSFLANVAVDVPVLGLVEAPIEKSGSFPVVKAPTISVSNLSVKDISFSGADIEVELDVSNPNYFGLILNQLAYNVDLQGLSAIKGESNTSVEIGENETGTIKIPASFSFSELGMAAYRALTSDDPFEYSLSGSANVGATLPFFDSSSFNFDKSGSVNILK